ncbi:unnamed protein product [Owenia fusiformis]|uniref:Methyltransferase-like protein 22 n=1 Tax=Owenia fusiformis TaxID=6347 RepID=A0A8S4N6G1_OWEFU|nr:unnamed protein product [Owenia fusiformis]
MEPDEVCLSDVHVYADINVDIPQSDNEYKVTRTIFVYDDPKAITHCTEHNEEEENTDEQIETDEDGDLILSRKDTKTEYSIVIEHAMATRLRDVGLQVWSGALLLCDYILHHRQAFSDCCALELGGGVGLVSIVMAKVAQHIFCTDIGENVLTTCEHNVELNKVNEMGQESGVAIRELDWSKDSSKFSWSTSDVKHLNEKTTVMLAADVIYDNSLTDALFNTVKRLMSQPPAKTLYIAVEKRLNFTLTDLEVACPAYTHFIQQVAALTQETSGVRYTSEAIPIDFPQYFHYTRTKYLELWKIQAEFVS